MPPDPLSGGAGQSKKSDEIRTSITLVMLKFIQDYAEILRTQDYFISEFSEEIWLKVIHHATVCGSGEMTFYFKDGMEIRV